MCPEEYIFKPIGESVADESLALRPDFEAFETTLIARLEKFESTMLREFRTWAITFRSRFRANEILVGGFNERLIALEERVSDIEGKSTT